MAGSGNNPFTDRVLDSVAATLDKHVLAGQSLTVGLSGGLDSTVLIHAIGVVAASRQISVEATYVNHGLSPNADAWAQACSALCRRLDIPISIVSIIVPESNGVGVECAARKLRYQALYARGSDWVVLAHHRGDQSETLLHNLLRGTGVNGAAAMPERIGKTLRPLLPLPRAELLSYAEHNDLSWIEDESNTDIRYTRNHIRHQIMPLLQAKFPQAEKQLAAATNRFGEALSLLDDLARTDLGSPSADFPVAIALFKELSEIRALNVLRALLAWRSIQLPDDARLREFIRQVRTAKPDRHPKLNFAGNTLECRARFLHLTTA
jgi:tRNA(Ile)-lysidine synthase